MADYLAKLAARTLNLAKLVQPLSSLAIGEGPYLDTEYPSVSTIDSRKRSVSVDTDQLPSTSEEKPRVNSVQTDRRSDSRVSVERSQTPDPEHVERYRSDIPGTNVTPKRLVTKAEIEGVSHKRTRRRQNAETPVDTTFREQKGESVRDGSSPSKVGTRAEPLVDSLPALGKRGPAPTRDDTNGDAGSSHIVTRDTRRRGPVASLAREISTVVSSARHPVSDEVSASHIRRLRPAVPTARESRQTVQVTIGRIEVRSAESPAQPVRRESTRRSPALTLDEYLKRRNEGNR